MKQLGLHHKIALILGFLLSFGLAFLLYNYLSATDNQTVSSQSQTKLPAIEADDKIWVITDPHYLSPSLHDEQEAFLRMQYSAAGKDLRYGAQRMEALIAQVDQEKPALLIVSGDLTFNGEKQSMEDLAGYFQQIEALGTQVLVIPGNHDISSGWARSFKEDKSSRVKQVLPKDFSTMFTANGYQDALAKDPNSLSYLAAPFDDLWFLMIDSNIYSETEGSGAPKTNGFLKKETLAWIDQQLTEASNQGKRVIPIVHHNILEHHAGITKGFVIDNAADLRGILKNYSIPLALSGHIHTQHIAQENLAPEKSLTEIVTGAFSVFPSAISQFQIQGRQINYQQIPLQMETWASQTGQTNPDLVAYSDYMKAVFQKDSEIMAHTSLHDENRYDGDFADQVGKFMGPINLSYFSGHPLSQEWIQSDILENPAYQTLVKDYPDSFLLRYTNRILESNGQNHLTRQIEWEQ